MKPPPDEPGNVFQGIASGLILMCMLLGLVYALVMVWRVLRG